MPVSGQFWNLSAKPNFHPHYVAILCGPEWIIWTNLLRACVSSSANQPGVLLFGSVSTRGEVSSPSRMHISHLTHFLPLILLQQDHPCGAAPSRTRTQSWKFCRFKFMREQKKILFCCSAMAP